MTKEQKKFLSVTLPKFILREQGRGFGMSYWLAKKDYFGKYCRADGIKRAIPKCDTVACIGGSIEHLLRLPPTTDSRNLGKLIGLTGLEAQALFYRWYGFREGRVQWPRPFMGKYEKAKTPLAKAKVAVALLKEVARTEGKCLHRKAQ